MDPGESLIMNNFSFKTLQCHAQKSQNGNTDYKKYTLILVYTVPIASKIITK